MKNSFKSLVAATAGLLLLAGAASANPASAWTQLGYTIELSSGSLNIAPVNTFTDAAAGSWHNPAEPSDGSVAVFTSDIYADASVGSSNGISTSLYSTIDEDYFLVTAAALIDAATNASGSAAATVFALYNLSFANVVGPTVTLTLTPVYHSFELIDAGGSFGYVSTFMSLNGEDFLSFADSSSDASWAAFAPITRTFGADEVVAFSLSASAGVGVPDTGSTALLVVAAMLGLVRVRRQLARVSTTV